MFFSTQSYDHTIKNSILKVSTSKCLKKKKKKVIKCSKYIHSRLIGVARIIPSYLQFDRCLS